MRIIVKLATFFVLLIFVSCQQPENTRQSDIAADVVAVLHTQVAAWNAGDIDGFMAGYWQSDSLRFASGGNITYGWQATLQRYKKAYPDKATMGHLDFSVIKVTPLGPEATLVFGRWRLTRDNDSPNGLFTLDRRKFGSRWLITPDHHTSANQN